MFSPGVSGNPGGRTKDKPFFDALRRVINQPALDAFQLAADHKRIDAVALELVREATEGKNRIKAAEVIRDTLEGKPLQAVEFEDKTPLNPAGDQNLLEIAKRIAFILSRGMQLQSSVVIDQPKKEPDGLGSDPGIAGNTTAGP